MKKILIILFCLLSISFTVFSQPNFNNLQRQNPSLEFVWAKQIFGVTGDMSGAYSKIITDKYGNIYMTGFFMGKCTLGNVAIYCSPLSYNGFYAKFDKNGNFKWVKNIGDWLLADDVSSIAIDDSFVYALCEIRDSFKIDLVYQNYKCGGLTNTAYTHFIVKSDINTGEVVSIAKIISTEESTIKRTYNLVIDNDKNLLISGAGFPSIYSFLDTTIVLSAVTTIIILKIKTNLTRISGWPKLIQSTSTQSVLKTISIDKNNNYYFGGHFRGSMYFDIDTITPVVDNYNGYLYKTNSNGVGQWIRKFQGNKSVYIVSSSINNNNNNKILVITYTTSNAWLRVDSTTTDTSKIKYTYKGGTYDGLYLCYNTDGTLQYWNNVGSTGNDLLYYSNYSSFIIGGFSATFTFQGKTFTYSGGTGYDAMGLFLDNNGVLIQAITGTGLLNDISSASTIDNDNNFYMIGTFKSNPFTIGTQTFTNTDGFADTFIAKYRMKY